MRICSKRLLTAFVLALALAIGACSDDDGPRDAAVADSQTDARVEASAPGDGQPGDAAPTPDGQPSVDGPSADAQPASDATAQDALAADSGSGVPSVCDPSCYQQGSHLCFKDPTGKCRDCDTDAHCTGNPLSLGPTCAKLSSNSYCQCASDLDCVGNPNGTYCETSFLRSCTCRDDNDCPSGSACTGKAGVVDVCLPKTP